MSIRSPQVFFDFVDFYRKSSPVASCHERAREPGVRDSAPTSPSSRFQCFAEHSSDAILMADLRAGTIDYLSPAAKRIWAHRSPIKTIADWEASIHPDDLSLARNRRELVRQGLTQRFRYRIIGTDGRIARYVRETSFSMPSHDGSGECIGGIVEDLSPEISIYLIAPDRTGDPVVTDGLRNLGFRVTTFSNEQELMKVAEVLNPGCVVMDLSNAAHPPEILLKVLGMRPAEFQIILVGGQNTELSDVIDALKAGAADYLVPPFTPEDLANAVHKASQTLQFDPLLKTEIGDISRERLALLPSREREVFLALVDGGTNKTIARQLQLSPRTIEVHRAHLMQRLNVRTLTELIHFAHAAGIKGSS